MSNSNVAQAMDMVACLKSEEVPYLNAAKDFVIACLELPDTPFCASIKMIVCYDLFHKTEKILEGDGNPVPPFIHVLEDNTDLLKKSIFRKQAFTPINRQSFANIETETGSHYGKLFEEFDDEHYYHEAADLLRTRFERNGLMPTFANKKKALDAGCGGGRYTVALKMFGFAEVVGLDYSIEGVRHANERLKLSDIQGVKFQCGNALELPFDGSSFDFVFSNGVLHHTVDMFRGIKELQRVLKPGGRGFLYLIENPGGIFWDVIEILRPMMMNLPYDFARFFFKLMGVPPNRRYYILDHIMVPINIRTRPIDVENMLKKSGAVDIKRLNRGTDFDRIEKIYWKAPYSDVKFGVGENRYFFRKPWN